MTKRGGMKKSKDRTSIQNDLKYINIQNSSSPKAILIKSNSHYTSKKTKANHIYRMDLY